MGTGPGEQEFGKGTPSTPSGSVSASIQRASLQLPSVSISWDILHPRAVLTREKNVEGEYNAGFTARGFQHNSNARSVLAVVLAVNQLPTSTITVFLGLGLEDVSTLSLLTPPEGANHPVQPFHNLQPTHCRSPTSYHRRRRNDRKPELCKEILITIHCIHARLCLG